MKSPFRGIHRRRHSLIQQDLVAATFPNPHLVALTPGEDGQQHEILLGGVASLAGRRLRQLSRLHWLFWCLCLVQPGYARDLVSTRPPVLSTGVKKLLIIRVDFPDLPDSAHLVSTLQSVMDTQVRPKFQQSSYGLADIVTTVTTFRYRMPRTALYYATTADRRRLMEDAVAAASANYAVARYDRHMLVFPSLTKILNSNIRWAGTADRPGGAIQPAYGQPPYPTPYVGPPRCWINGPFRFRIVAHELGHSFGLEHSGLWQVTDGNPVSPRGRIAEKGDAYDIMGVNGAEDMRIDFNPWFKNEMQWLRDYQVQTITQSGIYRVYRFDHASATGILALKIPRNTTTNYWISIRRSFTDNRSMQTGAYIVWGYNTNVHSALLDCTTPGTSILDAALHAGRTLRDGAIAITPLSNGGTSPQEYMDIKISIRAATPVSSRSPSSTWAWR